MALLDELPVDILLLVAKRLYEGFSKYIFYKLLPVASVNTRLRQRLLPLLYRDLIFEFPTVDGWDIEEFEDRYMELAHAGIHDIPKPKIQSRHNAFLAISAGCAKHVHRVTLFMDDFTKPRTVVRAVRDDMDAGCAEKWPELRSYSLKYRYEGAGYEELDNFSYVIERLGKKLPVLRQASSATDNANPGIAPLSFNPPSASFLTQLTSLTLGGNSFIVDACYLPPLFAPTLVTLTLYVVNPENIWESFYDHPKRRTVVFARLKYLNVTFEYSEFWIPNKGDEDAANKKSVWKAEYDGEKVCFREPLFPSLLTLRCDDMLYDFPDFISHTQCHDSLLSLHVENKYTYYDFDAELFENLETVEFSVRIGEMWAAECGPVERYKAAFTSLLRAKTNIQYMTFVSDVKHDIFKVPYVIGCTNLRSLYLGTEVDFTSLLRLLGKLKHLVNLVLNVGYYCYLSGDGDADDAVQLSQEGYTPVSCSLRRFTCRVGTPRQPQYYTTLYAVKLALHTPRLEVMTLKVDEMSDEKYVQDLLHVLTRDVSKSQHVNQGLSSAKVVSLGQF
ncbi:hypothetical protein GQ54DRAFT_341663 [Martensiomyces pterosporus]|nr:hypothetical protein GQ54DRAFT_341663 [Martensiomyces pterosporus]